MINLCKWAAFANALIVLCCVSAYDLWFFHLNFKMLCHKINGCEDGKIGVSLAAAGTANCPYLFQGLCRH